MRIALLGDIALIGSFDIMKNPQLIVDNKNLRGGVINYLKSFDLVIGNLETPFSISKKEYGAKSAHLCTDPVNVELLKMWNVRAVSLANNHIFDFGTEGYETTLRVLDESGISHFGDKGTSFEYSFDNNKLLFTGYCCYSSNPLCVSKVIDGYGINRYNVEEVGESIKRSAKDGFLNIVAVHAGKEHVNHPSIEHIRAARKLSSYGKYVYYGCHTHTIQGVEEYNDSLISHSCGNFCFDDIYTKTSGPEPLVRLTDNNRTGMILELTIENNRVVEWREQAIYIAKEGKVELVDRDKEMTEYNNVLAHAEEFPEDYMIKRQMVLDARIEERKSKRNVKWILKRLRPQYVRLMFDMRRNQRLFFNNVLQYVR